MSIATNMDSPSLNAVLSRTGRDGKARGVALDLDLPPVASPTSLVAYQSRGHLLIVGPPASVRLAAESVSGELTVSLLITDPPQASAQPRAAESTTGNSGARSIHATVAGIHGYLGNFQVDIHSDAGVRTLAPSILTANQPYDLVLDLGNPPAIRSEILPPGYYAPGRDGERIQQALEAMPDLVGEFEKPRYFNYNPDICAHGARGLGGCRRCLDACPAGAITSIGERIEVDAHLCQGGGVCASSCPSGAIRYAYPALPDLLARLRSLLEAYREAGGEAPVVLLHDGESGLQWLLDHAGELPQACLPFCLEEVASVGLESWLSLFAFGAAGVAVLCHEEIPASARGQLGEQVAFGEALLAGMGYPGNRIRLLEATDRAAGMADLAGFGPALVSDPARYQVVDEKRTTIRLALDHLYARAPNPQPSSDLPAGAPFGEIVVDRHSCTLCMSCASVCPAGAVLAGGELPQLTFIEQNCLQCGICASACPEHSISLRPRMLYRLAERSGRRVLNEDQPFHCLRCHKPFASTRTIEAILAKLAGHWMYADNPEQLRRLKMCDDCRVRDMFEQDGQALDVHRE